MDSFTVTIQLKRGARPPRGVVRASPTTSERPSDSQFSDGFVAGPTDEGAGWQHPTRAHFLKTNGYGPQSLYFSSDHGWVVIDQPQWRA